VTGILVIKPHVVFVLFGSPSFQNAAFQKGTPSNLSLRPNKMVNAGPCMVGSRWSRERMPCGELTDNGFA
jgi:hypothetical protein